MPFFHRKHQDDQEKEKKSGEDESLPPPIPSTSRHSQITPALSHSRVSIVDRAPTVQSLHFIGRFPRKGTLSTTDTLKNISLRKPTLAFIPEDGVPPELVQLEEEMEYKHHRRSIEESHLLPELSEEQGRLKKKASIRLSQQKKHSRLIALPKHAYDGRLPRPYHTHMKDLRRRRELKMVEIQNSPEPPLDISEIDKRVKFCPQGVLLFHILELENISLDDSAFVHTLPISYYCVMMIANTKRTSKIVFSDSKKRIRVDFAANFSIEVPQWRESPMNRFTLELWSFQDPEEHYMVGSMELHLFEFVRLAHGIERMQLWSDGLKVGKITYEFGFAYGYYGFGHSNHLRSPASPVMRVAVHSMYPRLKLDPNEILDQVYHIRMPERLKVFTYNSLILAFSDAIEQSESEKKAEVKRMEELPSKTISVYQVQMEQGKPVHCRIHMNIFQEELQPDFNDMFGEFVCFSTRRARLDFLKDLVPGRIRDIFEDDEGASLFLPLKEREAERIVRTQINYPGYLVHPTKVPCVTSLGTPELTPEDSKFQDMFPTVRRESGYLDTLFGYSPKPEASEFLNDVEAPLYKMATRGAKKTIVSSFREWFREVLLQLGAILNWLYNFVFPEVKRPPPVPEISVTFPTPACSTSKLHAYFVKDAKEVGLTKVDRLQQQTAALMALTESAADVESDDTFSSSSSDAEGDAVTIKRLDQRRISIPDEPTTSDKGVSVDKPKAAVVIGKMSMSEATAKPMFKKSK